jgi:hypothetical protein
MKNVFLVLSLLVVLAIPASAQTVEFLPDPNAVLVDMFPVVVRIALGPNNTPFVSKNNADGGDVIMILGGYRTQSGKIEYQMISDSIRYHGPDHIIDNTPTSTLYAFLAREAMFQGVLRGWTPAPDCSTPWYANVYSEPCVTRYGRGIDTRFIPCDRTNYATWKFATCRDEANSVPTIAHMQSYNSIVCQESCVPTYPNSDGGSTMQ